MSIGLTSETWLMVKEWAEKDIERLRGELEGEITEGQTWRTRGEIAALRRMLAELGSNTPPITVPEPDSYGMG